MDAQQRECRVSTSSMQHTPAEMRHFILKGPRPDEDFFMQILVYFAPCVYHHNFTHALTKQFPVIFYIKV